MTKNEDISSPTGSKGNVVLLAHQVASIPTAVLLPLELASDLTVDQLMQSAFFNGRAPRSSEYKAGTRMALEHRLERKDIVPPYQVGTGAANAFFAGLDEGKSIWRAAVATIGGAA